jgi:hypothetical protein
MYNKIIVFILKLMSPSNQVQLNREALRLSYVILKTDILEIWYGSKTMSFRMMPSLKVRLLS